MTEISDDYVSIEIRKKIDYLTLALRAGHPKDWTDYQFLIGQIRAYEECLQIILELKKKMEEEESK